MKFINLLLIVFIIEIESKPYAMKVNILGYAKSLLYTEVIKNIYAKFLFNG